MSLGALAQPRRAARLFALANIAFLAVDIGVAHQVNAFAKRVEWAPIVFSIVATLMLIPGACGSDRPLAVALDRCVGWGAIFLGAAGMIFHLESAFFADHTLRNLVYSAPFVAPLSYAGVGLLLVLLRSEDPAVRADVSTDGPAFGPWLVLLALGGFVGNFALSVLDHAQNGFFRAIEWVPVASAALAIGALVVLLAWPTLANGRLAIAVMVIQVVIGVVGFGLHITASYRGSAPSLSERVVYGAPVFAPLLFADIALLAGIGVWAMGRTTNARPA